MTNSSSTGPLDWLPDRLSATAFRLGRVDEAVEAVGALAAHWSDSQPIELTQTQSGRQWVASVVGIRPVPPVAAVLFSEAIHHLRAAIENTLFYLVENERGTALTERDARAVEMPVLDDESKFREWQNKVARRIPELGAGSKLAKRVEALQPYVDTVSQVPSISPRLAAMMGVRVENEHPMRLIQRYSNLDKHRSLRFCATGTIATTSKVAMVESDLAFRRMEVGLVLSATTPGDPVVLELQSALLIERPDSSVLVGPVPELTHLHRHVADEVIPTLVRGLSAPRSFPPQIELGDNGWSDAERLNRACGKFAQERWDEGTAARIFQAWQRTPPVLAPPGE
ncbi:hypothetical protein [Nocardia gipuzkoensis]|uniref:hypothetical protein n=1 Tax=Nocardia gipuzkoensis TaxID=2749991 RepID=UPI00237DF376|nr:hypothetical protein [Nocardia gipuzkoensis]MDE1675071.1 hypothetical protein [Nocardia gipuzkoensis]